jgi:hypothetical protein
MTEFDSQILKIYVLLSPLLVFAIGLLAVWLDGWMDRRDQRRKAR